MKNAVAVHVVYGLQHLVHVVLDSLLGKVVTTSLYRLIHVHVHELKDQSQSTCGLVAALTNNFQVNIVLCRAVTDESQLTKVPRAV